MPLNDSNFSLRVDYAGRMIHLAGEFDTATAVCLAKAISGFQRAGPGDITIDLANVTFIDAAGIGALVTARNAQTTRGDHLDVTGAAGRVRWTFDLVDQTQLLRAA